MRLQDFPVHATIMHFDSAENVLYAVNPNGKSIHLIGPCTQSGIPYRWLQTHGLDTQDSIETADPDTAGPSS